MPKKMRLLQTEVNQSLERGVLKKQRRKSHENFEILAPQKKRNRDINNENL